MAGHRIFVAGHRGMVGSALVRRLDLEGAEVLGVARTELDLRDASAVEAWLRRIAPDSIILAAAHAGGIMANIERPAEFISDNLAIQGAVIDGAFKAGVETLVFVGSSCIYPRDCPQPMAEDALMSGPLEPSNQYYAMAKLAGWKLCEAYRHQYGVRYMTVLPTNLYGPGDKLDPALSHVVAALMGKMHRAVRDGIDTVDIWGSGRPRREFLHVDDAADAIVTVLLRHDGEGPVNIGRGEDMAITELAEAIARVVGFTGRFRFDTSKPDGVFAKRLDVSRLAEMGWQPTISLEDGLRSAYRANAPLLDRFYPPEQR